MIVETSIKKGQQANEIIPRAAGNKNHANRWSYQGIPLKGRIGRQKTKDNKRKWNILSTFRNLPKGRNKARRQLKEIATGVPRKQGKSQEAENTQPKQSHQYHGTIYEPKTVEDYGPYT